MRGILRPSWQCSLVQDRLLGQNHPKVIFSPLLIWGYVSMLVPARHAQVRLNSGEKPTIWIHWSTHPLRTATLAPAGQPPHLAGSFSGSVASGITFYQGPVRELVSMTPWCPQFISSMTPRCASHQTVTDINAHHDLMTSKWMNQLTIRSEPWPTMFESWTFGSPSSFEWAFWFVGNRWCRISHLCRKSYVFHVFGPHAHVLLEFSARIDEAHFFHILTISLSMVILHTHTW